MIVGNYPTDHIYVHVGEIDVYLGEIFVTEANDATSARRERACGPGRAVRVGCLECLCHRQNPLRRLTGG